MQTIQFPDFMAVTFGLVTYLLGEAVNDRVGLLRRLSIPDPVTGGLIVAAIVLSAQRQAKRRESAAIAATLQ